MTPRTVDDVVRSLPGHPGMDPLPAPEYVGTGTGFRFSLATLANKDHMTNEGWELFTALESAGYDLWGHGLPSPRGNTHVPDILSLGGTFGGISTVVLQDKREHEGLTAERRKDPAFRFTNVEAMRDRPDVFKLTVLKDAQHDPDYNRRAAEEIGCHAWVVYYHPRIVAHLAPYVRPEHLVRTWHSLDATICPPFVPAPRPGKVLLSGALSRAYPLRTRLAEHVRAGGMRDLVHVLPHPGYHQRGCATPEYLRTLSRYRVAICTSSRFGYAVRKIMEATACGCMVLTDLPSDEVLPGIDANLVRVHPDSTPQELLPILNAMVSGWDPYIQGKFAEAARTLYDFRTLGRKLADDVEALRRKYNEVPLVRGV